jgi:hypothetical protein
MATGSRTHTVTFEMANGSYSYAVAAVPGYSVSPASGSVTVNGSDTGAAVTFTLVVLAGQYPVNFSEGGLAGGTSWSVSLNGTPRATTASSIAFAEPNGTYAFTIGRVSGYVATPQTGSVQVSGASVTRMVEFTSVPTGQYAVTFAESGLTSGISWSVTVNGTTRSSTTGYLVFTEPNGTYAFLIGSVIGYSATLPSGSVTVNGTSQSLPVQFTPGSTPPSRGLLGLPGVEGYAVLAVILAAFAVAAGIGILIRRSRPRSGKGTGRGAMTPAPPEPPADPSGQVGAPGPPAGPPPR